MNTKLSSKLLVSHLLVALTSIVLVGLLAIAITANSFEFILLFTLDFGTPDQLQLLTDPGKLPFKQQALDRVIEALLIGGAAASVVAAAISLFVSKRIVRPVRAIADASRYIAGGHYDSRVAVNSADELGELAVSFNQMAASLANIEAVRRQLIADVSHELKTPLASIRAYMEGFLDGVIAPISEHFHQVHREVARLQRLVGDLHELSLTAEGVLTIHPTSCNAGHIVSAVTGRLLPQFDAKGVTLVADVPPDLPPVRADRERVEQVLINLLGNGLQYTPAGGHVTVTVAQSNGSLRFAVQDTGIGIAPADLNRVFQRFFRVDKSRARSSGGSGIGLTIARHLVEAHRGRIWAESLGENQGATFYFTLPTA
ncbi:MAG: HAMP domain-containing protein [Anaerolineae bacterium]|nr:HAMP domain-containing protein [Anaerolineae bacterium]